MSIITEIVIMKTLEDVKKTDFINIIDGLEKNFHSKQPGFIDSELLYNDETREWIMIQHCISMEDLKSASEKMFKDTAAGSFVKALNPESIKMIMLPQLNTWK